MGCAQKANQVFLESGQLLLPRAHLYPDPQSQIGQTHGVNAAPLEDSFLLELTRRESI